MKNNKYYVVSEKDNIDAICYGKSWKDAVIELMNLNGYQEIQETDWTIYCDDEEPIVIDGIDL